MNTTRRRAGFGMVEIMVVVAIIAVLAAMTVPSFQRWRTDQRVKEAVRAIADLLAVARAEAIRSGQNHAVFVWLDAQGNPLQDAAGNRVAALLINDADADGVIDANETLLTVPLDTSGTLNWGVALAGAAGPPPTDPDPNASFATGFTFVDPAGNPAQWVVFGPDGIPRAFSVGPFTTGPVGTGGGGVYVTNTDRDYAVVLSPLGGLRVHPFDPTRGASGQWGN